MTTLTEGRYAAEFVLYEEEGQYSRDNITIASGAGVVKPGSLLAKSIGGTASAAAKSGGNTGTGTFTLDATTPVLAGAKSGVYTVRCIAAAANSGTFRVEDPDGNVLGDVAVAATFSDDIKFVIADGGSDFVVGDGFDVTVDIAGSKYVIATDSLVAEAINLYGCDATSADQKVAAITRLATVNGNLLNYDASVNTGTKKSIKNGQLAKAGIVVR